jgi:hypothetical protein
MSQANSERECGEAVTDSRETPEWIRAHEELSRLAKSRAAADAVEGRWLLRALRAGTHVRLGFGGFSEYVESLFGYKPRSTEEKLRVAEALENLPESGGALTEGRVNWSALRELTRVATIETEREWLEAARGRSIREIERLVSGRAVGDSPSAPARRELERHVLRFEVSGETLATFRDAMAKLRRDSGTPLDDDAALLLLARRVLGGPADEGRSSYQVAVTVCEECGCAFQQGRGELVEVGREIAEMAACDGQHVGSIGGSSGAGIRELEQSRTGAHVGATNARDRAKQVIPPAVRRLVMRRDQGRCSVPGCKNGTFLDVHHLELRSEGGAHDADNLAVVCGAHHRALHRGTLVVEGRPSAGLCFRHADGTRYGHVVSARVIDVHDKVFAALRGLGFRESEAKRALERVRAEKTGALDVEKVLREALAVLTPNQAA